MYFFCDDPNAHSWTEVPSVWVRRACSRLWRQERRNDVLTGQLSMLRISFLLQQQLLLLLQGRRRRRWWLRRLLLLP